MDGAILPRQMVLAVPIGGLQLGHQVLMRDCLGARDVNTSKKEDRAESPNIFAGFLEPESGCSWTYRRDLKIDKLGNRKTNDDQ